MEKKLVAKRGDHATGWYMTDEQKKLCSKVGHRDWCIFDEEGNIALMKGKHILCLSSKWVAEMYAKEGLMIEGLGKPIDDPMPKDIGANVMVLH